MTVDQWHVKNVITEHLYQLAADIERKDEVLADIQKWVNAEIFRPDELDDFRLGLRRAAHEINAILNGGHA